MFIVFCSGVEEDEFAENEEVLESLEKSEAAEDVNLENMEDSDVPSDFEPSFVLDLLGICATLSERPLDATEGEAVVVVVVAVDFGEADVALWTGKMP